jgi:DNA-binding transcriptional MocR family regulator
MTSATARKQINLLRGWPNPAFLPTTQIKAAASVAISEPSISIPGLLYGPDPGYQPLRESIATWLDTFYTSTSEGKSSDVADAERICITGGASQNLACVLQVYTDPLYTRVWMVAPCYFLACRIFEDAGLSPKAVPEGKEGVDLEALERGLKDSPAVDSEVPEARLVSAVFLASRKGKTPQGNGVGHVTYLLLQFAIHSFYHPDLFSS